MPSCLPNDDDRNNHVHHHKDFNLFKLKGTKVIYIFKGYIYTSFIKINKINFSSKNYLEKNIYYVQVALLLLLLRNIPEILLSVFQLMIFKLVFPISEFHLMIH
jgi:hypothetical protein